MCLIYKDISNCRHWSHTIGCYISEDTICKGEEKEKEKEKDLLDEDGKFSLDNGREIYG